MHESGLEAALRTLAPGKRAAPGECLDDLASARFAIGEMGPAERAQACEHLALCSACLDRITALVELEREDTARDDGDQADSVASQPAAQVRPRSRPAAFALAASVVLAVCVGLLATLDSPPWGNGSYREVRSSSTGSSMPIVRTPADGRDLRRAELRFEWTGLEAGIYYEVELLSGAGDILWQDRTEGTASAPPDSLYLEPGGVFYVWVRAHLNDGKTVKSPTVSFRILREG